MLRKWCVLILVLIGISWDGGIAAAQSDAELFSCGVEAVWINCWEGLSVSPGTRNTVTLHLRSHVGQGSCLPARVSLTAAYLDRQGDVLCVGTQEAIAMLNENVQDAAIEMNPFVLRNFSRWRNRPGNEWTPSSSRSSVRLPTAGPSCWTIIWTAPRSLRSPQRSYRGGLAVAECRVGIAR